jgi:tetratricopeptide (TPR) repeat protein
VTAAELFRRAGAARHAGELAAACALYDELQARFPAAEEARLSHVSLGKLLLAMGRPREAEPHFARYLAGGAGALAAEAAFGRAQSFEKMGRSRDEGEAWRALLRDFPGSVYESAARRRIAALEIPGAGPPEAPTAGPAGAAPDSAP